MRTARSPQTRRGRMSDESAARKGKKAEYAKYGKVHNFEGHFEQSVGSAENGMKFWQRIEKLSRSLNMQSILSSGTSGLSRGRQH